MLFYLYIGIVVVLLIYTIRQLFTEQNWRIQLSYALLLFPLLLRAFLIK